MYNNVNNRKEIYYMKKSLLLCLTLFMLFLSNKAYAEDINKNEWDFKGTITPKYEFMVGDIVEVKDLEIDGVLTNGQEEIKTSDLLIYIRDTALDKIDNNKTISVYLSSKNDPRKSCVEEVNIAVNEFNSALIHSLEGKEIEIDKIHWKSEDGFDTINYYDNLNNTVINYYGRPVDGSIVYSGNYYAPKLGYNTIKYRFTPNDERFEQIYGAFTVLYKTKPKINVGKTSFSVSLHKNQYTLYVNGKPQKTMTVTKLKQNTKYKVVIKQKNTPAGKNVTIWSGTVKTKK